MSYNSAIDKIDKIDVDKNDVDKIFTFDNINDKRHNGKHITMIEISPKEKYLITYSKVDRSMVGWDVENIDKVQLKFHQTVNIDEYGINGLCVSDDKKLAYIIKNSTFKHTITVIDMNNKDKKIALNLDIQKSFYVDDLWDLYCTFNLKGEFIIYSACYVQGIYDNHKIIWIYSTKTKNNKWECKRFYRIPEDYELISISKYDKVYLASNENDYIYEWSINTNKSVKIFVNNKDRTYKFKTKNIGIFSNEELIFLKINDKIIIVYSIELEIPIASLDINDDIQLYNFMNHTGLFFLPSLFYYTPNKEIKYCWNNKYKNSSNQTSFYHYNQTFVILNGRVWKSKFGEYMSKMNFSSENSDELNKENNKVIECGDHAKVNKKTYKHLNVHSFNLYMDTVFTLFQKATTNDDNRVLVELTGNLIKWNVHVDNDKIKLEVFRKINTKLESISTRIENHPYKLVDYNHQIIVSSLFNNNDIAILTTFGILIYTFSENNNSISLNYFYFMKLGIKRKRGYNIKKCIEILQHYKRKSTLLLPNYDSFRLNGWVSDAKDNKTSLLKYGVELLTFAIKEHKGLNE
ncbi:hypothetical protein RirG_065650 [Rhizophagus irregularis DAOM 197198w]|uniref:Uncharacterized protein n=1 Tax=Rhizophagus irregularis (strain DAOM 197198w) TaxID=1432141 RepID=A0A015LJH2_RHIIW|nr:hypothetical protein RirG_065650 [Rhizophagus irregularis DAOM 197198w]